MRLREGERVHEVSVQGRGESIQVVLDGRTVAFQLRAVAAGSCVVETADERHTLHYARDGRDLHLFWRGAVYRITLEREGAPRASLSAAHGLEAPMPGKVIAVRVGPGQAVTKGQELLVVEAMKMENALRAPRDGRVAAVFVKPGDMVGPGAVLVDLE